jgi:hypothetical protein
MIQISKTVNRGRYGVSQQTHAMVRTGWAPMRKQFWSGAGVSV